MDPSVNVNFVIYTVFIIIGIVLVAYLSWVIIHPERF